MRFICLIPFTTKNHALWLYKEEEEGCVEGGINGRSKKKKHK